MSSFKNKKVLLTGGAKGIGRLLGLKALQEGAQCIVVWDIDEKAMNELSGKCESNNRSCYTYKVNLSNAEEIEEAVKTVKHDIGKVDILFNNAGIVTGKRFLEQTKEDIQKTLAINIEAVMLTARAFLADMIDQNSGHIINISSASSLMGNPNMSVYAASKWAVTGWSESLRIELEQMKTEVKVTTVQPSYIDTGMFAGVKAPLLTPLLEPEEIADKIIQAVKRDKIILREPFMVKLIPFLKGILPARIFDLVAGKLFKVYSSMNEFKGRGNDE
jgi:short-subunit dehydrogenase